MYKLFIFFTILLFISIIHMHTRMEREQIAKIYLWLSYHFYIVLKRKETFMYCIYVYLMNSNPMMMNYAWNIYS